MVYRAKDLLARLTYLTLWGQNEDSELEWVGTEKNWKIVNEIENGN